MAAPLARKVRPVIQRLERLHGWRALAAAFGFGLLSVLAFPPVHVVPVLALALPGLLVLAGAAPGWKRAAVIGLFWGWGHFAGGLYWLTHAILTEVERYWWLVPIAVPALSLPLGLFIAAPTAMARLAPAGLARVLVFSGAWVGSELIRGVIFTGFPWNLAGTVWAFDPVAIQGAAWVGVHGLSLVTVFVATAPMLGWGGMGLGAGVLAAFGLFGWLRLSGTGPAPRDVALLLVQANIPQEMKHRADSREAILERYLEMTDRAVADALPGLPSGQRLVVLWPEAAVPYLVADDPAIRRIVAEVLPPGGILMTGTARAEFGPDRRLRQIFNSMAVVDDQANLLATFDKAHLVPFGEYMPLSGLMPIRLVPGAIDFTPGPGPRTLDVGGLPPFGPLVCYEVIFPSAVAAAPRPDWLVNVTNDAWYGISAGPYQHLATARFRAVEEGLPLVRTAQTGISAVFDAFGRTMGELPLGETGTLVARLPGPLPPTPIARIGLWIPGVMAMLTVMLGWIHGRRGKRHG